MNYPLKTTGWAASELRDRIKYGKAIPLNDVAALLDDLDTLMAILADIRQRLKGMPESKLDGEAGLAVATMRAAEACEEAQRLYAERQHEINLLAEVAIHVRADHWHKASAAVDAYDEWLVSDHLRTAVQA